MIAGNASAGSRSSAALPGLLSPSQEVPGDCCMRSGVGKPMASGVFGIKVFVERDIHVQ